MERTPAVWIVVLNWNGVQDTLACVRSLQQMQYDAYRIIIVDNGSSDGSLEVIRSIAGRGGCDVIDAGRNLGYAGGNNLGIRYALDHGADFVLVLNNDTVVDPTLLSRLVGAAMRNPQAACFGPRIFYMDDPERVWFATAEWSTERLTFRYPGKGRLGSELEQDMSSTAYVCGAAMLLRADVAREIGLFDERFFLVYEESDWCYRARRAGYECLTVPDARVWHKVGVSFSGEASPLRTYFSTRNSLLWAERNGSRRELRRMLGRAVWRLMPRVELASSGNVPRFKAHLWRLIGMVRECERRLVDPQAIARRRAVVDYLTRRFGDCPPRIRQLTEAWARTRAAASPLTASASSERH